MDEILKRFITEPLFDASASLLEHWKIRFSSETKVPISFEELYSGVATSAMPKSLKEVLEKISTTYFIGSIDDDSLQGGESRYELGMKTEGKYQTMLVFAVDVRSGEKMTRTELATLTRGFNRIAESMPVILLIKNGRYLSLATCERSEYTQEWRNGEKLGKVSILRDINCEKPHRGHRDILESIGDKAYSTYDEIYAHWLAVFSSELLTKKFYTELSEWYAWVIGSGEVRFPNDITTDADDMKYNHEAVIRLITRLIFVWFLRQKKLVPEGFFDEKFVRDNFIENFDPHSENILFYNPEESKYYRLILQNLFFAMLNRPIVDEESGAGENRRFATTKRYQGKSEDFNVNNLLRYKSEFKEGGAEKLLEIANAQIPFLNGGLFECLDHKDKDDPQYGFYFDGFSERKASLDQLSFPDYFFFGEKGEFQADLSKWYDDKKKKEVKVQGLINILKHYNFTVEENTPLDQEVSLDPELLGKVFENLLASYNPETNTSARKQTGSFYTPREIVKYMVDESLIAHLCRECPDIKESDFRKLLDYSNDNFEVDESKRKKIMEALYECKVLDPACGSGAFPMGMLQQMVHVLRKLDPSNSMWEEFILDLSLAKYKDAYLNSKDSEELNQVKKDIEQAFNRSVNDPDYARKLYLIEHCIYGVDIQPIAVQISKLRFFISLVAEQKPTGNAKENFGIRPLPNLEAKFVAANTLIPLEKSKSLFDYSDLLEQIQNNLNECNHKLFIAKRNKEKKELRNKIQNLRKEYSEELLEIGSIGPRSADMIANWNMFDQNSSAGFFDTEWMFGLKDGFDVVIGNPPYVIVPSEDPLKPFYDRIYKVASGGKRNLYHLFFERSLKILVSQGVLSFITPDAFIAGNDTLSLRQYLIENTLIKSLVLYSEKDKVFESVNQAVAVSIIIKDCTFTDFPILIHNEIKSILYSEVLEDKKKRFRWNNQAISRIKETKTKIADFFEGNKGDVNLAIKKRFFSDKPSKDSLPLARGIQIVPYFYKGSSEWCDKAALSKDKTGCRRIIFQEIANAGLARRVKAALATNVILGDSVNYLIPKNSVILEGILGVINSKVINYYFKFYNQTNHVPIGEFKEIPFPKLSEDDQNMIGKYVSQIIEMKNKDVNADISFFENEIDHAVYHLYNLTYDEVLIVDPETTITREEYERYE